MRISIPAAVTSISLALVVGCGKQPVSPTKEIDPVKLAEFKRAIPKASMLSAPQAQSTLSATALVGDPATYPNVIGPIAVQINGMIGGTLNIVEAVAQQQPTLYNSDTSEFLWGPYDNSDTALAGDSVALYIHDKGAGSPDFRYEWGILRGMSTDVSTMVPVIWGGATPDATVDDYGSGVLMYDFVANNAFEDANDPSHGALDQGRFVSVFAKGLDSNGSGTVITLVVSAFRNFIPANNPTAPAASADYFYGGLVGTDGTHVDFVDFAASANVDSNPGLEQLDIHLAMINGGAGRAEASAAGGDIVAGTHVTADECWGATISRTYMDFNSVDDASGTITPVATEGTATDCVISTLADVPALSDLPADLTTALDNAASNGAPQHAPQS